MLVADLYGTSGRLALKDVSFSHAELPVKAHEALSLGGSVLHEQESEIFLHDIFVLD